MSQKTIAFKRRLNEEAVTERFLDRRDEQSFEDLFHTFSPQLIAYFRAHRCSTSQAEDLAQDVMLAVYLKASQVRDGSLFRGWLYRIAHNALCRSYGKRAREFDTVNTADMAERLTGPKAPAGGPAFEFTRWMAFLDSTESEVMRLRFIEEWEYHEIASAHSIPIGTVQWRVFNAKKKLAPHLTTRHDVARKAA